MNKLAKNSTLTEKNISKSTFVTVMCNAFLVATLVICLVFYIVANSKDIYEQNAETLTNIAQAKATMMDTALESSRNDLARAYNWCKGHDSNAILDYLNKICIINGDEFQLLKYDTVTSYSGHPVYTGYSTKKDAEGNYMTVRYENSKLSSSIYAQVNSPEGQVAFSQSFDNATDPISCYSVFCALTIEEEGIDQTYYLVKLQRETTVINYVQTYTQYSRMATAVCYQDGKYLANDNTFSDKTFFEYIATFNDLLLEDLIPIKQQVQGKTGIMTYKGSGGIEYVYAFSTCGPDDEMFIVVAVPEAEFRSQGSITLYPFIIIIFLVALLLFNVLRLLRLVNQLKVSVKGEQIANRAKSSFLSRMSHEIRTPLNAVIGYNAIARNALAAGRHDEVAHRQAEGKVLDCLAKSEIASKHLLTVVNDVLDMSAIESGRIKAEHERFDFKGLITSLSTVFYSQAKSKGVDFEVVFGTLTEEWFVGDQMRVSQILTNLLANAVKFTPEGGKVKLIIEQPESDVNASHIKFKVTDTGIGMSKDYVDHIWVPFEQADSSISRRFGGSGLGLSITKNLVEILGGKISVSSTLGEGTVFEIDLSFERTEQPKSSNIYDFSSINALIVDDDVSTCDYVRLLFNRCGVRCAVVTSGEDAINAVSVALRQNDAYTICLIDWRMPDMDGIETIQRIRSITDSSLPIIVLTAYDYTELADKANEVGISKFIAKPLFQSSLFDLLATVSGIESIKDLKKSESIVFAGERVLLAEDNEMNMEIAKTLMESAGLTVDCAWNGVEAVQTFCASAPNTYSAILMDVHMPELNGHDATKAIRASTHPQATSIPIIAMTADAFAENVAEAHAAGMNTHIAKPIDTQVLFDTLRQYIPRKNS